MYIVSYLFPFIPKNSIFLFINITSYKGDMINDMAFVTGKNNILIGRRANVSDNDSSNQIVIGSGAKGYLDNTCVIGNNEIISFEKAVNASAPSLFFPTKALIFPSPGR